MNLQTAYIIVNVNKSVEAALCRKENMEYAVWKDSKSEERIGTQPEEGFCGF